MSHALVNIPLDQIQVGTRRRPLGDVRHLAESISVTGLLNPIVVARGERGFRLISGNHRLAAARLLCWETIPARVHEHDELDADLAEIDENLARTELTVLERAKHLADRKAIYEARYPASVRPKGGRRPGNAEIIATFAGDAAQITGVSPRTIRDELQIATKLPGGVRDRIRSTPLANRKVELLKLAKLTSEEQRQIADVIASGDAATLRDALRILAERQPPDDVDFSQYVDARGLRLRRYELIQCAFDATDSEDDPLHIDQAILLAYWCTHPELTLAEAADWCEIKLHELKYYEQIHPWLQKAVPESLCSAAPGTAPEAFASWLYEEFIEELPARYYREIYAHWFWAGTRGDPDLVRDILIAAGDEEINGEGFDPRTDLLKPLTSRSALDVWRGYAWDIRWRRNRGRATQKTIDSVTHRIDPQRSATLHRTAEWRCRREAT